MWKHLGGGGFILLSTIAATAPSGGGCAGDGPKGELDGGNEASVPHDSGADSGDASVGDAGAADGEADAAVPIEANTESGPVDSGPAEEAAVGGDATVLEGGGDGGAPAMDPISLSTTSLSFADGCGGTPGSQSFTLTNVSAAEATWTATVQGNYSIDVRGSTLAAGAAVTVTVSPPPVPQHPSSTQVDGGLITISSTSTHGATFSDSLTLQEFANACIAPTSLPTSLDFGDVSVGSEVTSATVCPGPAGPVCYPQPASGPWELGSSTDANFTVNGPMAGLNGNCFTFRFAPETVGPHTMTLTWLLPSLEPFCTPPSFVIAGTGVAADAGATDAGESG